MHGVRLSLRHDGARPGRLRLLPYGSDWPFTVGDDRLSFTAPELETLLMFDLES